MIGLIILQKLSYPSIKCNSDTGELKIFILMIIIQEEIMEQKSSNVTLPLPAHFLIGEHPCPLKYPLKYCFGGLTLVVYVGRTKEENLFEIL